MGPQIQAFADSAHGDQVILRYRILDCAPASSASCAPRGPAQFSSLLTCTPFFCLAIGSVIECTQDHGARETSFFPLAFILISTHINEASGQARHSDNHLHMHYVSGFL